MPHPALTPLWPAPASIRGFTLIEMLVVMLIMGLFVGLISAIARPDDRSRVQLEAKRLAQLLKLWLWPALNTASDVVPARYPVLTGVARFEVQYLDANQAWADIWPVAGTAAALPRAVRPNLVLASGEDIVRVFVLAS